MVRSVAAIVLIGAGLAGLSAQASLERTVKEPPAGMWLSKGSTCVVVKEDPYHPDYYLVEAEGSVLMFKPAEGTVKKFRKLRLKARLIPAGTSFASNAGKAWAKSEVSVYTIYPAVSKLLIATTYAESTFSDWDVQVKLTWDRIAPFPDWNHQFRIKSPRPIAASCTLPKKRPKPRSWRGTVTVAGTGSGALGQQQYVHNDELVYTLTGTEPTKGVFAARLRGSGSGSITPDVVDSQFVCLRAADPAFQWSYTGQGSVGIAYTGGAFHIRYVPVTGVPARSVLKGCGLPDEEKTVKIQVPPSVVAPQEVRQSATPNATTLSGSQTFKAILDPFENLPNNSPTGTITVTWRLTR